MTFLFVLDDFSNDILGSQVFHSRTHIGLFHHILC